MASDPISQLIGIAGSVAGGFLNKSTQQSIQAKINEIYNRQNTDYELGRNLSFGGGGMPGMFSNLNDPTSMQMNQALQYLYGTPGGGDNGQFGALNDLIGKIFNPNSVSNAYGGQDPYGQNIPGLQQILEQMQGTTGGLQNQSQLASQIFGNNGSTPQSQASFQNLAQLMQGFTPQQQAQTGTANNIFNSGGQSQNPLFASITNAAANGLTGTNPSLNKAFTGAGTIFDQSGQTADTNNGINAASSLFANGGMNPLLQALAGAGGSALGNNGLTPTGAQGETAALKTINNLGQTPTTQGLQSLGLNLAGKPSLLPIDQVLNMTRDQTGTNFQQNMEAARRQAIARGGGAGSNVASGLQNQGLADYSDKGAQAAAQAAEKALMDQQGLQLQQAGMGANMAQQGGALANSNFGTATNALTGLENVAANRFGTGGSFLGNANSGANANSQTGLGALTNLANLQSGRQMNALDLFPQISNSGVNQQGTLGNLGLANSGQSLQALGLGNSMYQDVINSMLGATNSQNGLIGNQNQYALGAGNLANQGTNDLSSILQAIMGGQLGAAGQGLSRTNSMFGQQQQGIQNQGNQQNFIANQGNQASQLYNNLFKTILGFGQQSGTAANNTAMGNVGTVSNPWDTLVPGILDGLSGMLSKNGGPSSAQTSNGVNWG